MDFKGLMSKAGKAFGEEVDKKAKEMIKATKKDLMRRTDSEIKNLYETRNNNPNLKRYIEEIEDFSCHCFRHTFATRCFEAGIQPKTVQKYLGHATLQMTMDLYTSVMPKHLSDEMGKLDNELDKISRSGEDLIDSRYKKETKKDILDFPGNTVAV